MDTHVRLLGILNIIFGMLSACFAVATLVYFGSFGELFAAAEADFTVAALAGYAAYHALGAVPCIVLGFATMRYHQWARSMLTIVSALNLLNVPIGSAIGGYSLWVLLSEESEPLFAEPPPDRKPRKRPPTTPVDVMEKEIPKVKSTSVLQSRGADAGTK